jgi:hypothetical protein
MRSHKSSSNNSTVSFHHFFPGLPVSLTLCPISQCAILSQMVSICGVAEVAYHAERVGAGSNVVKMSTQAVMPDA